MISLINKLNFSVRNRIKFNQIFKIFLNTKRKLIKKYISNKMETIVKTNSRLITTEEQEKLNKLMEELNVSDKNMPDILPKNVKTSSFGGRIRVSALIAADADKWIGKVISVGGWVKTIRLQGGGEFSFIEINDGSNIKGIQVVVNKTLSNFSEIVKEGIGSCFQIRGLVVKSLGSKQPIELQVNDHPDHYVKVLGTCDQGAYPLIKSKDKMKLETLREICHLRPRTNTISVVARIRNNLAYATHLFFQSRGFLYVHTPIITGSDCEGAGEMFQVTTLLPKPHEKLKGVPVNKEGLVEYKDDFFGKPSYLTVSGQLAVENYACALSDVYTFGPTFRAEVSHTTRHLSEFWMIEPEMCFADIYDDMECAENYLKFCLKYVLENNKDDLIFLDAQVEKGIVDRLKNVVDNDFKRLSYTEAIELLKVAVEKDKNLFKTEKKKEKKEKKAKVNEVTDKSTATETSKIESQTPVVEEKPKEKKVEEIDKRNIFWGMDMASEHERYITEVVYKKPTIVYNYPKEIKSFYMKQNVDGKTVAAMDILVPKIGEIIGGSQREERLDVLENRITELGMELKSYWWYLELRKFGSVPHAGFGLGFERLVMMATGLENIRDVIPYPRYPGHSEF